MPATITREELELAKLPVGSIQDVLVARLVAREQGARLGFDPQSITRIATAVSEIARNVVQHAGCAGHLRIFEIHDSGRRGLKVTVQDEGSGIADVDQALSGVSPGAGIPGCRKLMDELVIHSHAGAGTTVSMVRWLSRG